MAKLVRIDRSDPANIPAWQVIGQEEDASFETEPGQQPDVIVTYETRSGFVGTLRVPRALLTPQWVASKVDELAALHDDVARLRSGA